MNRLQVSIATADGALLLFLSLVNKCNERYQEVLKSSITLLMLALSRVKSSIHGEHKVTSAFEKCVEALNTMVVNLIGGSFFGGKILPRSGDLPFASKELKV